MVPALNSLSAFLILLYFGLSEPAGGGGSLLGFSRRTLLRADGGGGGREILTGGRALRVAYPRSNGMFEFMGWRAFILRTLDGELPAIRILLRNEHNILTFRKFFQRMYFNKETPPPDEMNERSSKINLA